MRILPSLYSSLAIVLGFSLIPVSGPGQPLAPKSREEAAVRKVLTDQALAWNRGSVEEYMKGYWKDDSLTFVGHGGITYGYNQVLDNYKKNYHSTATMGKLFFTLLRVTRISSEYYFVTGKWFLKRIAGDIGGYYTLLFRKVNGHWVIVTDHTS